MKFLCVKCDSPMQIKKTDAHMEIGSLSVMFTCPKCDTQVAMLTNPGETQLLTSLGVKLGGMEGKSAELGDDNPAAKHGAGGDISKCPFAQALSGSVTTEKTGDSTESDLPWTSEASGRLDRVPDFIRPMARISIERFAKDHGYSKIDEHVLEEAKEMFGM